MPCRCGSKHSGGTAPALLPVQTAKPVHNYSFSQTSLKQPLTPSNGRPPDSRGGRPFYIQNAGGSNTQ